MPPTDSSGRAPLPPDATDDFAPGALFARAMKSGTSRGWEAPSVDDLQILMPRYRIHTLIGRGAMGAVYQASQPDLERDVAIKLLPVELAEDPEFVERFRREARVLASLDHPGIVRIHDFGQTAEGHLYFITEFVDGHDLRAEIQTGTLSVARTMEVIRQVCEALQYAHGQGIVHRDIKPANILLTRDGRVKLADFGLARPLEHSRAQLTLSRVAMGTPDYMAPEQRHGEGDHRADLYAVGVVLYEMLCGCLPQGAWQPPSQKAPVDNRIDHMVAKAMQPDVSRRYQQATELGSDLDAIRNEKGNKPRGNPLWLVALLALAAGIWMAWPQKPDNTPRPSSPANSALPPIASAEHPWINSLGLRFLPIPGAESLLCATETRESDWRAFLKDRGHPWKRFFDPTVTGTPKPDDHPIGGVSWHDANAFCDWLTEMEHREGKLPADHHYRLPTDREWSLAARLRENQTLAPADLSGKAAGYAWGAAWPPPVGKLNVGDVGGPPEDPSSVIHVDDFDETCPVDQFPPNPNGFFGLTGNVAEWTWDKWRPSHNEHGFRVLRGRGWFLPTKGPMPWLGRLMAEETRSFCFHTAIPAAESLLLSNRERAQPEEAWPHFGFRLALSSMRDTPSDSPLPAEEGVRVNSLGMHLIPSGAPAAPEAFISRWETRVRDYQVFAGETGRPWQKPPFPQGADHPAVMLSLDDCEAFCQWLTDREKKDGLIPSDLVYRLPETSEWLRWMVDGPADTNEKVERFKNWIGDSGVHENVWDLAACAALGEENKVLTTINDGYVWTAPVGSYVPLKRGIYQFYDVGGNVFERQRHPRLSADIEPDRIPAWGESYDHTLRHDWFQPRLMQRLLDKSPSPKTGFRIVLAKPVPTKQLGIEQALDDSAVFEGHTYAWVAASCTWTEADAFARKLGGHLVTITSQRENEWLFHHRGNWFVGCRRPVGVPDPAEKKNFTWVTGEAMDFDGWREGEPGKPTNSRTDEPVMILSHYGGKGWYDYPEKHDLICGFIIEWDSVISPP